MTATSPRRVAVVGSGVAGLVAAHVATGPADVTLYEADTRLGGHADTHDVDGLAIDTGFIVHNRRTYPTLLRLFDELGIATQESEMSMSVNDAASGLEWAGALGRRGLFPTGDNLRRPAYLRMLVEIPRFHRLARRLLASENASASPAKDPAEIPAGHPAADHEVTLRVFLDRHGFGRYFRRHFAEPLVAAVWSCDPALALDYPARHLFTFLQHHGMLQVFGSPTWRTVTGGSRAYVDRLANGLGELRLGTKVTSIVETADGVEITDGNGRVVVFDAVIVATHPPETLAMLAEPTPTQREILGAIPYSPNTALLHTDISLLPSAEGARASWNFYRPATETGQVTVTYDLTRLQRLVTDTHYLVTLGGEDLVDPARVIARREYAHPLYTPTSVAARDRQRELDTERIHFAGAWQGWGFHEDGARSGFQAAQRLGLVRESWHGFHPTSAVTSASSSTADTTTGQHTRAQLADTTIRHTRRSPVRHSFSYRSHTWLVDVDHLPEPSRWASFEARDHLGDPDLTLRANIDAFLAARGVDLTGGRVQLLAHPRSLGHCFNPISVWWCWAADDSLAGVVVEVHNTYGDRHAYLVHPDQHGHAEVDKAMYVSPFHDVSGTYTISVPTPSDRVAVSVTLHRDGAEAFTASLTGTLSPAPTGQRPPWRIAVASLIGAWRIRRQGITLWLRRLPIQPRPTHRPPEGV